MPLAGVSGAGPRPRAAQASYVGKERPPLLPAAQANTFIDGTPHSTKAEKEPLFCAKRIAHHIGLNRLDQRRDLALVVGIQLIHTGRRALDG